MSIFDDIRRDREAGTPGRWGMTSDDRFLSVRSSVDFTSEHICSMDHYRDERASERKPNAARIARVPELERIALAAEELAAAVDHERNMVCQDLDMQLQANNRVEAALAKLREATA